MDINEGLNKKIGDMLQERRESLGLSQQNVADYVNVTKSAISRWENGEVGNIGRSKIKKLSEILKVSPANIVLGEEFEYQELPIRTKKVPFYGNIAAGEPMYVHEEKATYMEVEEDFNVDFCLKVNGDSMIDARIMDGDIVFIREQPIVENGEIAAVLIDDEVTLKRFYKNDGLIMLRPENSKYEPLMYTEKDFKQVSILGKAIFFQSEL